MAQNNTADDESFIDRIDRCLPQTQCTLCSFPRCRDYAAAIARNAADINQCPPGGDVTISKLSSVTGMPAKPLNPEHGEHEPKAVAKIREAECIGCRLCIKACPVDCVVGAGKLMHTVIAGECTGCRLCVPVCPTDCIDMVAVEARISVAETASDWPGFTVQQIARARRQTRQKLWRVQQYAAAKRAHRRPLDRSNLQRQIAAAVARKNSCG